MLERKITLTPDELNKLQAQLDQPMTIEEAEDVLQEFGFIDGTTELNKEPPAWYDPANGPYRVFLQVDRNKVEVCQNEQEVLALAQKALDEEIA